MPPTPATKDLRPADLAKQLFDAALAQNRTNPRAAKPQLIDFLVKTLLYAIEETTPDPVERQAQCKIVGEAIVAAGVITPVPTKP